MANLPIDADYDRAASGKPFFLEDFLRLLSPKIEVWIAIKIKTKVVAWVVDMTWTY